MPMKGKPFGCQERCDWGADIDAVSYPLAAYWTDEDCPSGHPVLEAPDGGRAKEEDRRLGHTQEQREWIVVTARACVSIFSVRASDH